MLRSMTGFGGREGDIKLLGKVSIELRSSNHKFLDISFHLPEGFLSLEERVKREIEAKVKRGRVVCAININAAKHPEVFINTPLLQNYVAALKKIEGEFQVQDGIRLDTLIHLPGVLSLVENRIPKEHVWPHLKALINQALEGLVKTRQKEGRAICAYLKGRAGSLNSNIQAIKVRFKRAIQEKLTRLETVDEKDSFLKNADISEEIDRLSFHVRNFKNKLSKDESIGKELDFIAQEMQREANTMAAKSCDKVISGRVLQIKSQIEKIREQAQNIE